MLIMADKSQYRPPPGQWQAGFSQDPADRVEQILNDAEELLDLTLSVHDRSGIFATMEGQSLLAEKRRMHRHPFCQAGRFQRPGWNQNCVAHCRDFVNQQLVDKQRPFVHLCWKGVREAAAPIVRDGVHLATLFGGLFRGHGADVRASVGKFPRDVKRMHQSLPVTDRKHLESVCRALTTLGQGLLVYLEQYRQLDTSEPDRKTEVLRFIHYHAHQQAALTDLARALHLSPSRTSHLVRELFDRSFKQLLIGERIRRARSMLASSSLPVRTVAERVGMPNEYYFNRLFKQHTGLPPGAYRRANRVAPDDGPGR